MKKTDLRYIAYVRKSEERQERQELSHQGQIDAIKRQFPDLNIVKWLEPESQSAFKTGRPVFNQAMLMIEQGIADGLVAYHPNRLSRNELDAGRVTYALRDKHHPLKDLKFCSFNFDNNPTGIAMLQMVMSQSQLESASKAVDVARGMMQKAEGGERPGRVWPGYAKVPKLDENGHPIVDSKDKTVITRTDKDPLRYDIVSQMWQWLLYDRLTPPEIRRRVNAKDYRSATFTFNKDSKRGKKGDEGGGVPMPMSMVYRIFRSPFYYGYLEHEGELYKGSHHDIRMISEEEFDLAQYLLGERGRPRQRTHLHAYTGLMRCGQCNCQVTATIKTKLVKSTGKLTDYAYYHCTRKSDRPCDQNKFVPIQKLEQQIETELSKFEILPEFREIAFNVLRRTNKAETANRTRTYRTVQDQRQGIQAQIDELLTMRTKHLLDDDEYIERKTKLKKERKKLDGQLNVTTEQADRWLELTEKAFDFAAYAPTRFRNADLTTKANILRTLGESLILENEKLLIEAPEWLVPLAEHAAELQKRYLYIRTNQKTNPKELELALENLWSTWRATWDSNPGHAA